MAVATRPKPLRGPLPGGSAGATVRVHPLRCGEVLMPPRAMERPSGPLSQLRGMGLTTPRPARAWVPVPVFLVEHPTVGRLLIDTGFHGSVAFDPRTSLGRAQTWMLPARQVDGESAPEHLHARGIEPEEITVVVMTHLHNDHASGAEQFPGATFVIDGGEWRAACKGGFAEGYRHEHFDQPFDWRTVEYHGPEATPHAGFEHSLDLFGDGSVRLLSTPGHTRGHQSILLALRGRELLLTADAAYTRRTIADDLVPIFTFAGEQPYRHSLAQIRTYVEATPDAVVICGHDAQQWPQLHAVYA